MQYGQVIRGRFLARPNRFIAHVALPGGETVVCHVKNTGRCRELLTPDAAVYLERAANPDRRTAYDLIAVEKGDKLINMDAQAPNRVFAEWAHIFDPTARLVKPEFTFGRSRLDFCLQGPQGLHLVEVKGVTLEDGGHALFPDAPTERGVRHLRELASAVAPSGHGVFCDTDGGGHGLRAQRRDPPRLRRGPASGGSRRGAGGGVYLPRRAGQHRDRPAGTGDLIRERDDTMTLVEIFLVGVGLSMDAFAVAICKGLAMPRVNRKQTLLIGLYFGVFQAVMPLTGWLLGSQFACHVTKMAPWIAFVLLAWIGGSMIRESLSTKEEEEEKPEPAELRHRELLMLAIATSIDALAVGVSFSMVELTVPIYAAAILIGCTTFAISVAGVFVGNLFGARYKNRAEFVGGAILILIGLKILMEHFGVL